MTEWPFHETYKVDLPPTQIREAQKRCLKKNIVDLSAPSEETQNIILAVFNAYQSKKSRARAASARSRSARSAEAEPLDIEEVAVEVDPTEETVCEVVAEAAPSTPAEPEPAAAPPTKAASKVVFHMKSRADNVGPEAVQKKPVEAPPAPAPQKRPAAEAAPARRRGGLCAMVAEVSLNASP